MNEHLKERILRAIEALPDERGYQVLDYVEFLGSKYAERAAPDNVFTRLSDKAEDLMRAGKLPISAIGGTVSFFDGASKVMKGFTAAAQVVVDEAAKGAQSLTAPRAAPPPPATPPTPPSHDGDGAPK